MKRALLFVLALATASGAEARDRRCGHNRTNRLGECVGYAFFEAFPVSGAGTSGACSTTAPTGAKGETATVTRATSAMCQSTAAGGMVSSGIGNGELQLLSSGVARQEYDRNGVLGVRVEAARTNSVLRSQEFDNAAWTKYAFGDGSNPTVTANHAVAPDGTTTAERIQFTAVGAGNQSAVLQASGITSGSNSAIVYMKGTSGSGSTCLTAYLSGGGFATCSFVSTSWTRCQYTGTVSSSGTLRIGNDSAVCSGGALTAQDVLMWQADWQGGSATSSIPTVGATATRNADVVSFPVTLSGSTFSAGISYDAPAVFATGMTAFQVYVDANNSVTAALDASNKLVCTFRIGGSDSTVTTAGALTAGAVNRVACTYGASGRSACLGGTCTTTAGALTMFAGAATFYGGTRNTTGNEANGVLSRWCYDPADPRCVL